MKSTKKFLAVKNAKLLLMLLVEVAVFVVVYRYLVCHDSEDHGETRSVLPIYVLLPASCGTNPYKLHFVEDDVKKEPRRVEKLLTCQ